MIHFGMSLQKHFEKHGILMYLTKMYLTKTIYVNKTGGKQLSLHLINS